MAPAISQTPLLSWRSDDVTLKAVFGELRRLEAELARLESQSSGEQPHPRTSSMNMIAISSDADGSLHAASVLDQIAVHHPSRVMILELGDAERPARIDAEVLVGARELTPGVFFPFERILLKVDGPPAEHVITLVEPFLQPDLPTHVWWMGDPPLQKRRLLDAIPMCATLLVDSAGFSRALDSFAAYSKLVQRLPEEISLADLHWIRLRPWREMLAQLFAGREMSPLVRCIRDVEVDYTGRNDANPVMLSLLVGWLASTLGWKLSSAKTGRDGRVSARFADGETAISVSGRPRQVADLETGHVVRLRVRAEGDCGSAVIVAERDGRNPRQVHAVVEIGGHELERILPLDTQQEGDLLVRALMRPGRDPIYLRSLKVAGEIMKSLA